MLNWDKANRKRMNAGVMKELRMGLFKKLLVMVERYKRVNQYQLMEEERRDNIDFEQDNNAI